MNANSMFRRFARILILLASLLPAPALSREAHAQAAAAHSVEAILVFEDAAYNVRYAYRGHTPAIPTASDPITSWNWFSGNPQAPELDQTGVLGDGTDASAPYPAQPKVAFSREGYALAIWSHIFPAGQIDCTPADPTDNSFATYWQGHLDSAIFRDTATGPVAGPSIDSPASTPTMEHLYTAPSIAIDSNGQGLAMWMHVIVERKDPTSPCTVTKVSWAPHYSRWDGMTNTWVGDNHIGGAGHTVPSVPAVPHKFSTAVTFNARVLPVPALPAAAPLTREQAVAVWYDYAETQIAKCNGTSVPFALFWPKYAIWNGSAFGAPDFITGRRPTPGNWESIYTYNPGNFKIDISSDQRGNSVAAFSVATTTDPCRLGSPGNPQAQVWSARWNNPANNAVWAKSATAFDAGLEPTIAFRPGAHDFDQRAEVVYPQPDVPYGLKRATYLGFDVDTFALLGNQGFTGLQPTNVYLPNYRSLLVFQQYPASIISWQEREYVAPAATASGNLEAGRDPDLAARNGSPTLPLARYTVISYGAGDNDLNDMMATVMNRISTLGTADLGSTNLISWLFHRDFPGANTRTYIEQPGAAREVRDWGANLDFSSGATLRSIIAWNKEYYPADKYVLTLEDHGAGWRGACIDDTAGGSMLSLATIRFGMQQGIQGTPRMTPAGGAADDAFSHVIFEACQMGMVETAYAVRGLTEFMLAGAENLPVPVFGGRGIPYELMLQDMIANPFITDQDLANGLVDEHQNRNQVGPRDYNFSAVHVPGVAGLVADVNALAQAINDWVDPVGGPGVIAARRTIVRNHIAAAIRTRRINDSSRDLFDFAQHLSDDPAVRLDVRNAADAVLAHRLNVVTRAWSDINTQSDTAVRGLNAWRGLNIWLETHGAVLRDGAANSAVSDAYNQTDFAAAAPQWHAMLLNLAQTPGLRVSLDSPSGLIFIRASDTAGNSVGHLGPPDGELCRWCASDIPDAVCYSNAGGQALIFVPAGNANGYHWFVDGALLTAPATYTATVSVLGAPDQSLYIRVFSGTLSPGQVVSGTITLPHVVYLPLIMRP